ncbi:TRAP transporter substrate-binding protein DctP [Hoeflea poritis]|uniref:TRAP transporter substrate-binding protein DctP n=1 Tax=Hoeflea poritis TaxID=2993659 RepID=A0ABT4VT18_9HYPH|nr:TRAP transporter substrate-binding protein DctP [Hoeflea poritis]MDA4847858.1 TRAP transporter substrate-binding protein DctP [Hoeflea poritis]
MKVGRVSMGLAVVGLAAGMALSPRPVSADETVWRMHAAAAETRVEIQNTQWFADRVGELSGGKIKIDFYPGGALGVKDADMLQTLPPGNVVQAALLYPGYLARDAAEYAVTLPPGVLSQASMVEDALATLKTIYDRVYNASGIRLVGFIGHAASQTHIFCSEPINSLEDLRSRKLRVWEEFQIATFGELGIAAQIIGQNDLYVALSTGVVDCAVYPAQAAETISLQEVAPHASYLFPFVLHPLTIVVSESAYESLDDTQKSALQDAANEATERSFEAYVAARYDAPAIERLKENGLTVLPDFSAKDQAAFTEAALKVWRRKASDIGDQAVADVSAVTEALGLQ